MPVPNYINILASNCFMDPSGALMEKGTLTVTAVDATGKSVPFHIGGGGIATVHSITRSIAEGSLTSTLQLANPAAADISIGYTFIVIDSATSETTTFSSVAVVGDDSGNFDLAQLPAGSYAQAKPIVYVTGPQGAAATVTVGTTTTLAAGASATVTNTGTSSAAVLNFGIPQGEAGTGGGGSGTQGPPGADGLSAYQLALLNGFSGTVTQWLASLVGRQGGQGTPGSNGTNGTDGAAATIVVGTVTGLSAGSAPTVTSSGSPNAAILNFGLPAGAAGTPGTPATPNTATAPLTIANNVISIPAATDLVDGYLSHADHAAFSAKQAALTLTTTGTSGAATLIGSTLNIPSYAPGTGTVTSVSSANGNATVATPTTTPVITIVSAPKLTTARTINGTSFDGSANITVTAAAGTLTGSTLASGVSVPASQVTGLAASATTDTTNASNITTGTLPTAATAALTGDVTKAAGTSATVVTAVNGVTVTGTPGAGQVITATSATAAAWQTPASSGFGTFVSWNNQATVAASTTAYYLPYAAATSAIESRVQFPVPFAGTVKNLFVWVSTANNAQSATGSLVLTVRKNGAATGLTVTIPAGSTTTTVQSDTNPAHSFTVVAGDLLSLQVVNNATATSAGIASASVVIQ
jgi:hypothetical protein